MPTMRGAIVPNPPALPKGRAGASLPWLKRRV